MVCCNLCPNNASFSFCGPQILKDHGDLQSSVDVILGKAQKLLAESALPSERSKLFARPTAAGQFAFELAQVAHYLPGASHVAGFSWRSMSRF